MKRLIKVVLLALRYISERLKWTKLYYWAENRLVGFRSINPMPDSLYCYMYRMSMKLVDKKRCIKLADWMIHRIPYNMRCHLA